MNSGENRRRVDNNRAKSIMTRLKIYAEGLSMLWKKGRTFRIPYYHRFLPFSLFSASLSLSIFAPPSLFLHSIAQPLASSLRDLPYSHLSLRPSISPPPLTRPDLLFSNLTVLVKDSKEIEKDLLVLPLRKYRSTGGVGNGRRVERK